ncbi:hypothetical protein ACH5RR_025996 [Cinchona calisaya]|uniref:Uncharacterized protein n=1 Tax=Cinchona calisaya TaxID=153742 RepID=A0ABD2Z3H2_9GENT
MQEVRKGAHKEGTTSLDTSKSSYDVGEITIININGCSKLGLASPPSSTATSPEIPAAPPPSTVSQP